MYSHWLLQDPTPLGEIILGPYSSGYWVDEDVPERIKHNLNVFMLHVPARANGGFPLLAEDSAAKKEWMEALQCVIDDYKTSPDFFAAPGLYESDDTGWLVSSDSFDVNPLGSTTVIWP